MASHRDEVMAEVAAALWRPLEARAALTSGADAVGLLIVSTLY